jgi:hypothetical protein
MVGGALFSLALVTSLSVGAQAPADPALDPPPLLDSIPATPTEEPAPAAPSPVVPRPIDEPEDTERAPAPDVEGDPREEPDERPTVSEPNQDWLMLGVDYAIIFLPLVGGPMFAPLAQGLAHKLAGESLVDNEYPNWWMGTVAGYGVYAVAMTGLVGGYVLALYGVFALGSAAPLPGLVALLGGGALALGSVALMGVEPLIVFLVARTGARPTATARGRAISFHGDADLE